MSPFLLGLTSFSVIACGLVSGVFLTFSDFVMRSLHKSEREAGIEAMQIINREVFRTLFMVLLIGMSALSPILVWLALQAPQGSPPYWVVLGSCIYILGVFVVTVFGNVPMNTKLDRLDHTSTEAAAYWAKTYYPRWTLFNHIRTFGAAAAAVCFLIAIVS